MVKVAAMVECDKEISQEKVDLLARSMKKAKLDVMEGENNNAVMQEPPMQVTSGCCNSLDTIMKKNNGSAKGIEQLSKGRQQKILSYKDRLLGINGNHSMDSNDKDFLEEKDGDKEKEGVEIPLGDQDPFSLNFFRKEEGMVPTQEEYFDN